LVVASLAQPVAVERNRYKDRWIFNAWPGDRRPQEAEEFSQLSTQPFATMKLQLQDGGSQVAGVKIEAPCEVECIFLTAQRASVDSRARSLAKKRPHRRQRGPLQG
jgi:hypothetical protein